MQFKNDLNYLVNKNLDQNPDTATRMKRNHTDPKTSVVDPKWFFTGPIPDPDPTFHRVSDPIPNPDPNPDTVWFLK